MKETIQKLIRRKHIEVGTMRKLAELSGIPLRTLEAWKAGTRTPNFYAFKQIVIVLEQIKAPKKEESKK